METAPSVRRPSLPARWKALSSKNRRRIVLGSLFAVALAARDVMLLMAASSMFAISELGPATARRAAPA